MCFVLTGWGMWVGLELNKSMVGRWGFDEELGVVSGDGVGGRDWRPVDGVIGGTLGKIKGEK